MGREVYRQVDTVDKTAIEKNIRAHIPRLAWWIVLTSGVRIKMGMRTGGKVVGEDVLVREDVGGGTKQADLFDVEATQVKLPDLL